MSDKQPLVVQGVAVPTSEEQAGSDRLSVFQLVRSSMRLAVRRTVSLLAELEIWATSSKKSLHGFAALRIVSSVAAIGYLVTNFSSRLYVFGSGAAWSNHFAEPYSDFATMPVFGLTYALARDDTAFTIVYCGAIAAATALLVGFRSRLSAGILLVLWIGIIELNRMTGDASDNISRIIILSLVFADAGSRWSLDGRRRARFPRGASWPVRLWRQQSILPGWLSNAVHNTVLVLLVYQLIVVYFSGGLFKAGGETWRDGTAVWGPLHHEIYIAWPWFNELLVAWGPAVAMGSVGTVLLQVSFPFMLLRRWTRIIAVSGLVLFHLAIAIGLSLVWFSTWMLAIDALLISDRTYRAVARTIRRLLPRRSPRPKTERPTEREEEEDAHVQV